MDEAVKTLLFGLDKLDMMLNMYTRDLEPAHWAARPWSGLHSAQWILAHLALSLNQEAGEAQVFSPELDRIFDYGAPTEEERESWPSPDELKRRYDQGREALAARWRARPLEEWLAPLPENRLGMENQLQAEMFTLEHAVYHVGQLGAIRRLLGLKGVV